MKYIIHPLLEINVFTHDKRYISYFNNEYQKISRYRVSENCTTINVYIVRKLPVNKENSREKIVIFKKLFKYKYVVCNLNSKQVDIYFRDTFGGRLYRKIVTLVLQAQVLEPVIYYKLLEHNILFMHAAGVTDGTRGYLFPAHGGAGKTTLTLGLMGEGMQVLGDDLLMVESDTGIVYPYLRPLHIFTYNINTLRDAIIPLTIKVKLIVKDFLRAVLEWFTNQDFLISTRVHADVLYETFRAGEKVNYKKILFLKKTGEHEKIRVTLKNVRELARLILDSEDLNDSLYKNVLRPDERNDVVEREVEVISKILIQIPYFELINTKLLDFRNLSDFKQKILK